MTKRIGHTKNVYDTTRRVWPINPSTRVQKNRKKYNKKIKHKKKEEGGDYMVLI